MYKKEKIMKQQISRDLPSYKTPPVIEVVFGIFFQKLEALKIPHFGLFWQKIRKEFPECVHAAPLGITLPTDSETSLPLPRIWFVNKDEINLIQLQTDCFFFNWRKVTGAEEYPRYSDVKKPFEKYHNLFIKFLQENNLGEINYKHCELTYINHIYKDNGWNSIADISQIMRDLSWNKKDRFLPEPKTIQWLSIFPLPEDFGELKVSLKHGIRWTDNHPLFVLEISTKGLGGGENPERISEWFDLSHEWIVKAFADVTNSEIQKKIWRRQ